MLPKGLGSVVWGEKAKKMILTLILFLRCSQAAYGYEGYDGYGHYEGYGGLGNT